MQTKKNSLCDAIGFFNPVWDSKEDQDTCFFKAVAVAKQILENQIASANAVNRADEKVQQAYKNSRDGIVGCVPLGSPHSTSLSPS